MLWSTLVRNSWFSGWSRVVPHEPIAQFVDSGYQLSRDLLRDGIDEPSRRQVVIGNRKPGCRVIELSLEFGKVAGDHLRARIANGRAGDSALVSEVLVRAEEKRLVGENRTAACAASLPHVGGGLFEAASVALPLVGVEERHRGNRKSRCRARRSCPTW